MRVIHSKKFTKLSGIKSDVYRLPRDKEQRMYDFYMLSLLPQHYDNENIEWAVDDVREKLLPGLKQHLLNGLYFAICAELRHFEDRCITESSSLEEQLDYEFRSNNRDPQDTEDMFLFLEKSHTGRDRFGEEKKYPGISRIVNPPGEGTRNTDYQVAYKASVDVFGKGRERFMELASILFHNGNWEREYGGDAWGDIADGWLSLYHVKTPEEMIIWIDHIYDLQHNNDTVFNKLDSYYDEDGSHRWIKDSLDHKAAIKSPYELFEFTSPHMKRLSGYALKDAYNTTYEGHQELNRSFWRDKAKFDPSIISKLPKDIKNNMLEELSEIVLEIKPNTLLYLSKDIRNRISPELKIKATKRVIDEVHGGNIYEFIDQNASLGDIVELYGQQLSKEKRAKVINDFIESQSKNPNRYINNSISRALFNQVMIPPNIEKVIWKKHIEGDPLSFVKGNTQDMLNTRGLFNKDELQDMAKKGFETISTKDMLSRLQFLSNAKLSWLNLIDPKVLFDSWKKTIFEMQSKQELLSHSYYLFPPNLIHSLQKSIGNKEINQVFDDIIKMNIDSYPTLLFNLSLSSVDIRIETSTFNMIMEKILSQLKMNPSTSSWSRLSNYYTSTPSFYREAFSRIVLDMINSDPQRYWPTIESGSKMNLFSPEVIRNMDRKYLDVPIQEEKKWTVPFQIPTRDKEVSQEQTPSVADRVSCGWYTLNKNAKKK